MNVYVGLIYVEFSDIACGVFYDPNLDGRFVPLLVLYNSDYEQNIQIGVIEPIVPDIRKYFDYSETIPTIRASKYNAFELFANSEIPDFFRWNVEFTKELDPEKLMFCGALSTKNGKDTVFAIDRTISDRFYMFRERDDQIVSCRKEDGTSIKIHRSFMPVPELEKTQLNKDGMINCLNEFLNERFNINLPKEFFAKCVRGYVASNIERSSEYITVFSSRKNNPIEVVNNLLTYIKINREHFENILRSGIYIIAIRVEADNITKEELDDAICSVFGPTKVPIKVTEVHGISTRKPSIYISFDEASLDNIV